MSYNLEKAMTNNTAKQIRESLNIVRDEIIKKEQKSDLIIYGFHINSNESDPASAITYLEDAEGMTPARMNYNSGKFEYGSWKNAFFMPRPCMVKYNGKVAYYLDPDDYNKIYDKRLKELGQEANSALASRDTAVTFPGNAMMEWGDGEHQIWTKVVPDEDDPASGSIYISNKQVDGGYTAYPFINNQGNLVNHFYTAIYNGSITAFKDSSNNTRFRLRSIPYMPVMNSKIDEQRLIGSNYELIPNELDIIHPIDGTTFDISGTYGNTFESTTAINEVALAYNNNLGLTPNNGTIELSDESPTYYNTTRRPYVLWNTEVLCDIQLINNLLILIGKSLDTQTVFGMGNKCNEMEASHFGVLYTGSSSYNSSDEPVYDMNQKGLFWGSNISYNAVKVFGMENWWGNQWKRYAGHIRNLLYYQLIKQTYGTEDGSTSIGYSLDGYGYISMIADYLTTNGYISKHKFFDTNNSTTMNINALLPTGEGLVGGSNTSYYCDFAYCGTDQADIAYAYRGGSSSISEYYLGAFNISLKNPATVSGWDLGTCLSLKPYI